MPEIINESPEIEWNLAKVLEKNLKNYIHLRQIKKELNIKKDFSVNKAFFSIDTEHFGYLDYECFHNFFLRNKISHNEEDILFIIRKISEEEDSIINYENFSSFFKGNFKNSRSLSSNNLKKSKKNLSEEKSTGKKNIFSNNNDLSNKKSPLRITKHESPYRKSVTRRRLDKDYHFNQELTDEIGEISEYLNGKQENNVINNSNYSPVKLYMKKEENFLNLKENNKTANFFETPEKNYKLNFDYSKKKGSIIPYENLESTKIYSEKKPLEIFSSSQNKNIFNEKKNDSIKNYDYYYEEKIEKTHKKNLNYSPKTDKVFYETNDETFNKAKTYRETNLKSNTGNFIDFTNHNKYYNFFDSNLNFHEKNNNSNNVSKISTEKNLSKVNYSEGISSKGNFSKGDFTFQNEKVLIFIFLF